MTKDIAETYIAILTEELVPAMGCTEPIALSYAAARLVEILGKRPEKLNARCSGNIIKNVRCVQIPSSGGMTGIEAAVALGAFGGDANRGMEVLSAVTEESRAEAEAFLLKGDCKVEFLDSDIPLHFIIEGEAGGHTAGVEVRYDHTNIVEIQKDGQPVWKNEASPEKPARADRSALNLEAIKDFADNVPLEKVEELFEQVIRMNMDIAYEGMSGSYGLGIGRVLREAYPESCLTRMKAYTAAASEARMDGCDMPVVINSGSGNQGIASTVPVIVYCRENAIGRQRMVRALTFSSLLTIYQKEFIGKLSAFCGAVSSCCASGASITYMRGGSTEQIKATIDNTLANIPGIICDGAKISCAAKIASSLDAAMMAHELAMRGKAYQAYTGILQQNTGETISCVGYIGRIGMKQTDKEILNMMLK
ncbi:MAG: serine dehydratase subunit alpha family protein [Clostridia bacterium]|nr:serine dehydratase subunit alpha family protein [Clostridia bacterium]